ncbi:MAG: hypothetical protein IPK27_20705 [Rhodanobacteraceae bacterium]|nr:hypothetical protein [Rhodanobacteraceae bacterium]
MQNLVALNLSESQLAAVDAALLALEAQLVGLVSLPPGSKRRLAQLGDKSEAFCRQTLRVLGENPQLVPATLDVAHAQQQSAMRDQLRNRSLRLSRLMSRLDDTEFALGSDALQAANQGYALLKVVGKAQGLDGVRKDLSARFVRRRRQPSEETSAA